MKRKTDKRTVVHENWSRLSQDLIRRDPALGRVIQKVGAPILRLDSNPYRSLSRSILSQQLATAAARSIIGKYTLLEKPFPKPESVIKWNLRKLRTAGVSAQKAGYLKALSQAWLDPAWRRGWNTLDDEALIERLVQVKGIVRWTAQMFLMFSLGRHNILPIDDFGIRKGVMQLRGLKEMPKPKEVASYVAHWEGAWSIGCWYLWRGLDQKLFVANPAP